jgi:hypothetical protein
LADPLIIPSGEVLPLSCQVGDVFYRTAGEVPGVYTCVQRDHFQLTLTDNATKFKLGIQDKQSNDLASGVMWSAMVLIVSMVCMVIILLRKGKKE